MDRGTSICNLTAQADHLRLGERSGAPNTLAMGGMSAEIVAATSGELVESGPAERDALYVVTDGYGVLQNADDEVDFTTGDILFAPAGTDHRFAKSSRRFRAWKILLRPKRRNTAATNYFPENMPQCSGGIARMI